MLRLKPLLQQLSIKTKEIGEGVVRFPFNGDYAWCQEHYLSQLESQYNAGKPVRAIVLKARQLGISTATEGVIFNWMFLYPGANGLIMANESTTSSDLFQMTKTYWDYWPLKPYAPELKYDTKQHMRWAGTNSNLRVATAKNVRSGRGSTIHALHATEVAMYDDPETLFTGLNQTIPTKHGTIVVLESTANGSGNWWHQKWQAAESGESEYLPLFYPWFKHPDYARPTTLNTKLELTSDEKRLLLLGASYENLQWRRWAIVDLVNGDEEEFKQEYPATANEAFLTTGKPVFPSIAVEECYKPLEGYRGHLIERPDGSITFEQDPNGYLTIYKKPGSMDRRPDRYMIGDDSAMTLTGDMSAAQVINRQTNEQVAVYRGRLPEGGTFGLELIKLGKFYNECMICPEILGGGQATISMLLDRNYPNIFRTTFPDRTTGGMQNIFGWQTNFNRKQWALSILKKLFVDRSITIHDKITYNELVNYILRSDGTFGNSANSAHDDTVSALSIAVTASQQQGPFSEFDGTNPTQLADLYEREA